MSTEQTPVPSSGTPTDSADSKTPANRRAPCDPTQIEAEANTAIQAGSAINDATVQSDVSDVKAGVELVHQASGTLTAASAKSEVALENRALAIKALALALIPVEALLNRNAAGGKAFMKRCRSRDPAKRGAYVVDHIPAGDLGLPAVFMTALRQAVADAAPIIQAAAEALAAKKEAVAEFMSAKKELQTAIALLASAMERWRISTGAPKKVVTHKHATDPAPTPAPAPQVHAEQNGAANGAQLPA